VNLNVIKWASYPTASPRVSGMNPAPSSSPVKAAEENGQWPRCQRLIVSLPRTTVLWVPAHCPSQGQTLTSRGGMLRGQISCGSSAHLWT
jgi:hypothetical protein